MDVGVWACLERAGVDSPFYVSMCVTVKRRLCREWAAIDQQEDGLRMPSGLFLLVSSRTLFVLWAQSQAARFVVQEHPWTN
jgi:hypothetical protein